MDKLVIAEVHPALDGEYELDVSGFTNFELHTIKKATGLTAGDLGEAYERLDNDVIVAMALVVLLREGKIVSRQPWNSQELDALWKAPVGSIHLLSEDEEEVDASPPELAPTEPDEPESESAKNGSSGESSSTPLVHLESVPSPTGDPT